MRFLTFFLLSISAFGLFAQTEENLLLSGPMVGYSEMREVLLWAQTNGPAQVQFEYSTGEGATTIYRTEIYPTRLSEAYTARLIADQVKPGQIYSYKLLINGKEVPRPYATTFQTPPLWQWRTDPPEFSFALGSCSYINDEPYDRPGKPYGGDYRIFESIHRKNPDLMVWLGDNTYLREADWYSNTGIVHRYTHTRNLPELQPLLASTAHYATWDDHDYGPNDSDHTFRDKDLTYRAFQLFWGNPSYGVEGQRGVTTTFEWGDAQFFLLDNRYFRDPNNKKSEKRSMLGETQLRWFIDALISSKAKIKFVCIGGQIINDSGQFENYSAMAPEEREYILNTIASEGIKNVIFLTGDRHHAEFSVYEKYGIKIYDFTTSPLTAGVHNQPEEPNTLRVPGSYFGQRNFAMIEVSGQRTARKVKLSLFDTDGKPLWSREIEMLE
ncbi:MAG: alkaline phosphatase D family protein [Bacteroidia bacterium]|nr:alkaline phosphatase D family protein [Bacteroidia bacterium]